MKLYPSIPREQQIFRAHVFDKLDGSNLRISWDKKRGWYDFASRTRSIPIYHPLFGEGYQYFLSYYKAGLESIIKDKGWIKLDSFFEFHGRNSFAGKHEDEPKVMTLIDAAPNNKHLLPPTEFISIFQHLGIPTYLGEIEWNEGFVTKVRKGLIEGITFEGVVGKSEDGKITCKAKTQAWIDKVLTYYHGAEADDIINS